jgi:hypothetical protein
MILLFFWVLAAWFKKDADEPGTTPHIASLREHLVLVQP